MPGCGCSPGYARDHEGGVDVTARTYTLISAAARQPSLRFFLDWFFQLCTNFGEFHKKYAVQIGGQLQRPFQQ